MKRNNGFTLYTFILALGATIAIAISLFTAVWRIGATIIKGYQLEEFTRAVYIAEKPYYLKYANSNGYCYTVAPPAHTIGVLVDQEYLESQWIEDSWFNALTTSVTYLTGSNGFVQTMVITVSVPEGSLSRMRPLADQYGRTSTSITFNKPLNLNYSHVVAASLDSTGCQG